MIAKLNSSRKFAFSLKGEHNIMQLEYALPRKFAGTDYVNAEFERQDGVKLVVESLQPHNGIVTVSLTQDITSSEGELKVQFVGYKMDGNSISEIAKSNIFTGIIDESICATNIADSEPSFVDRIQAWISEAREKITEAWELRHWHNNKATLDSLYSHEVEQPYDSDDTDNQSPSNQYLRARDKYLRKTEDGGVIYRVSSITKQGKKFFRFNFNWEPDLSLDLEAGNSIVGRPLYVDIPVEDVKSTQDYSLELDLGIGAINNGIDDLNVGLDSVGDDISELYGAVNTASDWDENDPTSRSYIANRTHWNEEATVTRNYTVEWADTTPVYQQQPWNATDLGVILTENKEYSLTVAGEVFNGNCQKLIIQSGEVVSTIYCIGNTGILDGTDTGDGFPMFFAYVELSYVGETEIFKKLNVVMTYSSLFNDDLSFSITNEETVYHKLPNEYLDDEIFQTLEFVRDHENDLGEINDQLLEDIEDNTEARHVHDNKTTILDRLAFASIGGTALLTYDNRLTGLPPIRNENDPFTGTITPHVLHRFGNGLVNPISSLTITGLSTSNAHAGLAVEYLIEFFTGAIAPTVTFPASVEWVDELTVEANKHYQISILDNIALWCAVDVEAVSE